MHFRLHKIKNKCFLCFYKFLSIFFYLLCYGLHSIPIQTEGASLSTVWCAGSHPTLGLIMCFSKCTVYFSKFAIHFKLHSITSRYILKLHSSNPFFHMLHLSIDRAKGHTPHEKRNFASIYQSYQPKHT